MLFSPMTLGELELPNRLVMAPLTRVRSGKEGIPGPLVVEHYRQRASLGLIVSEGTYPSHAGRGFPGQPGLVTDEQLEGWANVTSAVHAEGGRDLRPGHARRPGYARGHHRRPRGGRAQRHRHRRRDPHVRGQEGVPCPARPDHRGTAGHRPGIRDGLPQRGRGRIRRRRASLGQRLPAARVPHSGRQPARRRLRRLPGEPGALRDRSDPGRRGRHRRGSRRHPHLAGAQRPGCPRTRRGRCPEPPTATWWTLWRR